MIQAVDAGGEPRARLTKRLRPCLTAVSGVAAGVCLPAFQQLDAILHASLGWGAPGACLGLGLECALGSSLCGGCLPQNTHLGRVDRPVDLSDHRPLHHAVAHVEHLAPG